MARKTERSEDERMLAVQTVGFELQMMAHASALLARAEQADTDPMAQNAFLESTLLHARALVAFFVRPRSHASDIYRTDFAPEWTAAPVDAVKRLNDHYLLLHKYLAHLTWERVDKDSPAWEYPNIATDVVDVADAWLVHLDSIDRPTCKALRPHVFLARKTLCE